MTMDFDGIRASAYERNDDTIDYIAEALHEYLGSRTTRHLLIHRTWQVAGYRLAMRLLTRERTPHLYVQGFSQGFLLALHEYEDRAQNIVQFDAQAATKLEEKISKLLRLALHETTNENEARAAFHGFVKLAQAGEVAIFAKARMIHWTNDYEKIKQAFGHIMKQNPWLNLWGAK